MAGDWMKIEEGTPEKPEVLAMAAMLGLDPDVVFAKCFKLWRWAASNSADGVVRFLSAEFLDNLFDCPGFSQALLSVSWLQVRSGSLVIPNFDRHMSQSAKKRALDTTRKRIVRSSSTKRPPPVPLLSASEADKSGTREEKRREEKNKGETPKPPSPQPEPKPPKFNPKKVDLPPPLDVPEFRDVWEKWCQHRTEKRCPLTPTSVAEQLADFVDWGIPRAVAAIRFTIAKGWQGIRESDQRAVPSITGSPPAPKPTRQEDFFRKLKEDRDRDQG